MQKLLEVRCCCQPEGLLGWLPGPNDAREGALHCFVLTKKFTDRPFFSRAVELNSNNYALTLTIARIVLHPGDPGHLAFKAEGVNLDTLRRVSGFKEHHSV